MFAVVAVVLDRVFLERQVAGPKALRLWPGLYFDSDPDKTNPGDQPRVTVSLKVLAYPSGG